MTHSQSPVTVRLTKTANLFQAVYSDNGDIWQSAVSIGAWFGTVSYYVGLESLSDTISGPGVTFDSVIAP